MPDLTKPPVHTLPLPELLARLREQLVREVEIIPLEVVVRNVAAGSLSKRLGIEEGTALPRSIIVHSSPSQATR